MRPDVKAIRARAAAATCWVKVGNQHCVINLRTGNATPFEVYS
jgi:hypothetical protein